MFVLSADARRAVAAILARDRAAHVALESAAALHLGRAVALPIVVAARLVEAGPLLRVVPLGGARTPVPVEGLRVSSLEANIVELCARPTAPLSVVLAAELLQQESSVERRRFDPAALMRAARRSTGAARRRIAFLLSRAGLEEHAHAILPCERTGAVKLDPLGPSGGPVDGRHRVVVGIADGFPHAGTAWIEHVRVELGADAAEIALRGQLGFALARVPDVALWRGLFLRDGDAFRVRRPFDEACARIAAELSPRARRRIVDALARRDDPRARIDAALLDEDPGRGACRLTADDARRGDVARAKAVVDRFGARLASDVRRAFLERIGAYADAATLVRGDLAHAKGAARRQLLLAAAHLAWRRARRREALARLDELERERLDARSSIEAMLLRTALAVEASAHERARRLLSRAMRAAEAAGRDFDRARALHRVGTIEARRGRPAEASAAYRAALDALGPKTGETRALHGILESNLAATASWLGRWEEAEVLARAALEDKMAAGTFAEVVSTKVLLARIARARGVPLPPGGRVPPLIDEVERTMDPRLRVEAFLDLAEELAREDDFGAAERALEAARTTLFALDGSEPTLDALFAHVDGLLRGLSGDPAGGIRVVDAAAGALDRLHGAFWAARARRDAAALADAAGRRDEAIDRLREVARACSEHRFVLGEDLAHAATYALAALSEDDVARPFAERAIAAAGPLAVRTRLLELGLRARADALRDRSLGDPSHAVGRVIGPDGVRAVDAQERARLLRGVEDTIVLDERGPLLVRPDGVRVPLSRRRMIAPLLRALAARGGEPMGIDELAKTVWERRDASSRAAVKMSISRLRVLLGPLGDELVAIRIAGALAYGFRRPIPLLLLQPA